MDLLPDDAEQDRMIDPVEARRDITLDEPLRSLPLVNNILECRVAPAARPEPV